MRVENLLIDLVLLLIVLLATGIALQGWGALTLRSLGFPKLAIKGTVTVWVGLSAVFGFLEILHLFLPLDWQLTVLVFLLGAVFQGNGIVKSSNEGVKFIYSSFQQRPVTSLIAVGLGLYFCLRAMQLPIMYDSGLYHFASIRWLNDEPIVPGLGNLHWRLALNQSYFAFLALLNLAPYWNKGYAAGGLFLLLLTSASLFEFGLKSRSPWRAVVAGLLGLYVCQIAGSIANPSPDLAISLLEIAVFLFLLDFLEESSKKTNESTERYAAAVVVLCISIVTTKLSGLAFAAGCAGVVLFYKFRTNWGLPQWALRMFAFITLLALVHMARGFLLSGAPLFPSSLGAAWSLPWALPVSIAEFESELIYAWARRPGIGSVSEFNQIGTWFIDWLERLPFVWKAQIFFASLLTAANIYCLYSSKVGAFTRSLYMLYLPIFMAYIFWISTAPDPRFLGAVNIIYLALTSAISTQIVVEHFQLNERLLTSVTTDKYKNYVYVAGVSLLVSLFARWVLLHPLSFSGWPRLPEIQTNVVKTDFGLEVQVPVIGSQCWNTSIPCAPLVYGSLRKVPWTHPLYPEALLGPRYSLIFK